MGLPRRSEGNEVSKLVDTFLDVGPLFTLLSSLDHQVFYGRRGTGKTHALKYLAEQIAGKGDWAVYIDLRRIGSSGGIYSDEELPLTERGTRLLLDALGALHDSLMDEVLESAYNTDADFTESMRLLERLAEAITEVRIEGPVDVERTTANSDEARETSGVSVQFGPSGPTASLDSSNTETHKLDARTRLRQSGTARHHVHFGSVSSALERLVTSLPCRRLWILFDEWPALPVELQPLLADLLRRSVFPVPGVVVTLAAIEQRSSFRLQRDQGDYVGIEIGADAAADLDLDDFMVFGNDVDQSKIFFKELLYRHVLSVLPADGTPAVSLADADDFVRRAFTQAAVFDELVRAAEGVPRDAMNVVSLAAQLAGEAAISTNDIRAAARRWYLRDKESAIAANPGAENLLQWIIDRVIGEKRTKGFLLDQAGGNHPLVRYLYDERVLHIVRRGISSRDQPGVRSNAYALDFGFYVHLTAAKTPASLFEIEDDDGVIARVDVPGDDYRSIRTALLDLGQFSLLMQRP